MSVPPPYTGPPGPWQPPPPRRFSTGAIWGGIFLALPVMLVVGAVGIGGLRWTEWLNEVAGPLGSLGPLGLGLSLQVVPLIVGVVLAAVPGTPTRRGLGLGLVIGWAVWSIVGAGVCVLLIVAISGSLG